MADLIQQTESLDPFAPENATAVQLLVLLRLYDVSMGIYRHLDQERAAALMTLHKDGKLLLEFPWLDASE